MVVSPTNLKWSKNLAPSCSHHHPSLIGRYHIVLLTTSYLILHPPWFAYTKSYLLDIFWFAFNSGGAQTPETRGGTSHRLIIAISGHFLVFVRGAIRRTLISLYSLSRCRKHSIDTLDIGANSAV
mmetsp:Transcript_27349/g.56722  ORF Transcript_27349/g.56722 Transcript_27349/m.56722 type:complete len:125 (-) Transcript_27349:78-452(-)